MRWSNPPSRIPHLPLSNTPIESAGPDGRLVRFEFDSDPDVLVATDSDQWETFDGLTDWMVQHHKDKGFDSLLAQQQDVKGESSGDWEYRYKPLTSVLALKIRGEFDESLPPVPELDDENPPGIGMWSLVHSMYVQCGYDWYDESAASLRALQSRVKSNASYRGADAAREEYQRLLKEVQAYETHLETWVDEQPRDYSVTYPLSDIFAS